MCNPLCNDQYYYIIFIIGLTFVAEFIGMIREVLACEFPEILEDKIFPKISYKTILFFGLVLAFLLIVVDATKIVFNWNVDAFIKSLLCANIIATIVAISTITKRGINEVYTKKGIIKPKYSPDEMDDLTSDVKPLYALP